MALENLIEQIKLNTIDKGKTKGNMHYSEEGQEKDGSPTLSFSYKFPQGGAKETLRYDIGDEDFDKDRIDKIQTAKLLLEYHLKDNMFQVHILKEKENSAKIEIYHNPENEETPLNGTEDNLDFYLACEKIGLSSEESKDPYRHDRGREEWLKAN